MKFKTAWGNFDKLIDALYNNNMCSTIGDELIETFKNEITCKEDI